VSTAQKQMSEGRPVLVHCSDGWDRTPQVTSLVMLLEDVYYRTFEGFAVLIEQEWLAMGHKFHDRLGIGGQDSREFSPVFMQWLDCVHQVIKQNPAAFEFDDEFLVRLYDAVISARFGNFIFNTDQDRKDRSLKSKCRDIWQDISGNYHRNEMSFRNRISADYRAHSLFIWKKFWLRFNQKI
jgi:hypothetical protein